MNLAAVLVHFGEPSVTHSALATLENSEAIRITICILHDELAIDRKYKRSTFISSVNEGFAAGVNKGMNHLMSEHPEITHVMVMNPDVELSNTEIHGLISEHEKSNADCTFPSIREGSQVIEGYKLNRLGLLRPSSNGAQYHPGTCFLFSKDCWKKAGEMNENYFHFFEDIDFCVRMQDAGMKMHHARNIVLKHLGKSREDYPGTDLPRYAVRNNLRFLANIGKLNSMSFFVVITAHLLYLFRWKRGWRGLKAWMKGIQEFRKQ